MTESTFPRRLTVGGEAWDIAFDGTNLWVANNASDDVSKLLPLR